MSWAALHLEFFLKWWMDWMESPSLVRQFDWLVIRSAQQPTSISSRVSRYAWKSDSIDVCCVCCMTSWSALHHVCSKIQSQRKMRVGTLCNDDVCCCYLLFQIKMKNILKIFLFSDAMRPHARVHLWRNGIQDTPDWRFVVHTRTRNGISSSTKFAV